MKEFKIRTDLAVELKDNIKKKKNSDAGVNISEDFANDGKIKITKVVIENAEGEKQIGKPIGNYITIESRELGEANEGYHREVSIQLAKSLKELLPKVKNDKCKVLVVGLGNREATPDALGPKVIDNICITRKMNDELMSEELLSECSNFEVSGIVPGVMAQTGMESAEIIRGLVNETKPDVVIAIDALAARSTMRLNTTIQVSDTGINPGSGVGNHRQGITQESVGVPVIAIGIPTVVEAATIVNDTMENLLEIFSMTESLKSLADVLKNFTAAEKYELIREVLEPGIGTMYVTPKDVDQTIKYISYTISEALNIIWSENI